MLAGSLAIYAIMAACSAASGPSGHAAGEGGSGGGSGSSGSASGDGSSGILDALTDPVSEASADPYQSGSRLKAKYYAGADGSKQFLGWHDATLDLDCTFQPTADGWVRCIPTWTGFGGNVTPYTAFSDSGCSQRVALAGGSFCSTPTWASWTDPGSACGPGGAHLAKMGTVLTHAPAQLYSLQPDGSCAGSAVPSGETVFSLLPESAPSTFVQATIQTEP
jgi:hypothetical protein